MGKKMLSVVTVLIASTFALAACSSPTDTVDTASTSAVGEVERGASESSPRTVGIVNNTGGDITLSISGTDNYDWEGSRPDHPAPEGFQGTVLGDGKTETRTLTMNNYADGHPFTINFGVTGASVELGTKKDFATRQDDHTTNTSFLWGGWNTRGADYCETSTVESAGYTITVSCSYYATPNTTVTITK